MGRFTSQIVISVFIAIGCQDELKPLLPGLPVSVHSISFQKDLYTNSDLMLANGTSAIQFQMKFLDVVGKEIMVANSPLEVWVNSETRLNPPYRFTTEDARIHKFSIRTVDGEIFREDAGSVSAIEEPALDRYRVPVIFHHFESKPPYMSPNQHQALALEYLHTLDSVNKSFANNRGSKDPSAMDAKIEFYPAITDPEGKPLLYAGVNFTYAMGFQGSMEIIEKTVSDYFWPPWSYLNIWVVPSIDEHEGFAFYPEFDASESGYPSNYYGVYVTPRAALSTLLTHELGHALDLRHTFGISDCVDADDCSDTRSYDRGANPKKTTFGIRTGCNGEKFAGTNHMDYPYTDYTTFTRDQVVRMHRTLIHSPFVPGYKAASSGRTSKVHSKVKGSLTRENSRLVFD